MAGSFDFQFFVATSNEKTSAFGVETSIFTNLSSTAFATFLLLIFFIDQLDYTTNNEHYQYPSTFKSPKKKS